jgi:hypothetical protein
LFLLVILSDRTLSLAKGKGVEEPAFAFRALYQGADFSMRKYVNVGARSVRARLVGQGFNPDCRKMPNKTAGW